MEILTTECPETPSAIFGQSKNLTRLSVRAVLAFGRNTKTDDARAASQPKRRRRGAVRRANGLSADDTPHFHLRLARHRASPASFRPSGRPRVVGHETLRVTKGHESTHPSVVSDTRQSQSAQASSSHPFAIPSMPLPPVPFLFWLAPHIIAEQTEGRLFVLSPCLV